MSYATLEDRLTTWLADDDVEFIGSIPDLLALAELRVAKELNCDAMREIVSGTIALGDITIPKPAAVVAVRWIEITVSATSKRMLKLRQDSWIRDRYPNPAQTGTPEIYAFQDEALIKIGPKSDAAYDYEMMTEQRVVGLAPGTDTWVSLRQDDVLFYAAQIESNAFAKDSDSEKQAMAYYERALASAREEVVRGRMDANSVNR